jgi:hypothetical protein
MTDSAIPTPASDSWMASIPESEWAFYQKVIHAVRGLNISFALGGAFAVAAHVGLWRNTKDLDLYICPDQRQRVIDTLTQMDLEDYYAILPYDRNWIYRAYRGDIIIDIIWAMPNQRTLVTDTWLEAGPTIHLRGEKLRVVPAEEMIWGKIYVLQKERSDWTDIFNLIYAAGPQMDWPRLIEDLDTDAPLLGAALQIFAWLAPGRARELPDWLWERLNISPPREAASPERTERRANRLDSRPWFLPLIHGS